jgi:hypothetical protein
MGVEAKRFTYDVLLEDGGVLLADARERSRHPRPGSPTTSSSPRC